MKDPKVIKIPEILLPKGADMETWAVNACDQFTSDPAYWEEVERLTRGKVSAYHLILPEIYLKDRLHERIEACDRTMREYLEGGVFESVKGGFVLVERSTASGIRTGIVLAVDLEAYSYAAGAKTYVRSTEATIEERIPPRAEIRRNAPLELPHIMLLYNDPSGSVVKRCRLGRTLYDSPLMMGGGRVRGTYVSNAEEVTEAFYALTEGQKEPFLFAVGDGNHSLATAKACWEEIKAGLSEEEKSSHPARYALAEAVNIFDPALRFEPIHRLVKTDRAEEFIAGLPAEGGGRAYAVCRGKKREIPFPADIPHGIRVLDRYISEFLSAHGGEADYVHGEEELVALTAKGGAGVLLPAIGKENFFPLIERGGNLPKKTFSMGEGNEKRYYIEAKTIK